METIMVPATLPAPAAKATPTIPSILALDLGTTTGWAVRNSRCRILHGTAEFRSSRFEGGGMRYLRFGKWLDQTLEITGGIDAVYFEEVRRHLGTDAAHVFGGLLATLTAWCEENGIPYQGVPVGTIKSYACGKGNADKQAMIAAVRERGFEPADDNEADAIAILLWALETNGGWHEHSCGNVPQARRQRDRRAQHPVRRCQQQHGGHRGTVVGDAGARGHTSAGGACASST
jgi:Holliday junction resolvasome RuvABC endonuclease subunit